MCIDIGAIYYFHGHTTANASKPTNVGGFLWLISYIHIYFIAKLSSGHSHLLKA